MIEQEAPTFFKRGSSLLLRLVFFILLSSILLFADTQFNALNKVRDTLSVVLYPLQWIANAPLRFVAFSRDFLIQQTDLLSDNRRCTNDKLVLRAQLMQLEQLQQENNTLRSMLKLAKNTTMTSVLAQRRYQGYNPFSDKLMIDRGEKDGIKAGQAVLDTAGLLGQVTRVEPLSSEIRLIIDKDFPVPVMVLRNALHAVIYGGVMPNTMEIRFLPFNSDIKIGDKLVTSGLDGIYPTGIPVATVESIETSQGSIFARIVCKPFAAHQQARYVLIVTSHQPYPLNASFPSSREFEEN